MTCARPHGSQCAVSGFYTSQPQHERDRPRRESRDDRGPASRTPRCCLIVAAQVRRPHSFHQKIIRKRAADVRNPKTDCAFITHPLNATGTGGVI